MLNFLYQTDIRLFTLINNLPHNLFFDPFFSFLSGIGSWGIVWLCLAVIFFSQKKIKDKKSFFALFLAAVLSLVLVEFGLKNIVRRERPNFVLPETIVVGEGINSFSFPSGHTAVAFAGAVVLSFYHKDWRRYFFLLAGLISFSRIYLGKHYPSDVLFGMLIGLLIGCFSVKIINRLMSFDMEK